MSIKYIRYKEHTVYALYYRSNDTLYYNLAFTGPTKISNPTEGAGHYPMMRSVSESGSTGG